MRFTLSAVVVVVTLSLLLVDLCDVSSRPLPSPTMRCPDDRCTCSTRRVSCRGLTDLAILLADRPTTHRLDLYNSTLSRVSCSPLLHPYTLADLRLVRPRQQLCDVLACVNIRRVAITTSKVGVQQYFAKGNDYVTA